MVLGFKRLVNSLQLYFNVFGFVCSLETIYNVFIQFLVFLFFCMLGAALFSDGASSQCEWVLMG